MVLQLEVARDVTAGAEQPELHVVRREVCVEFFVAQLEPVTPVPALADRGVERAIFGRAEDLTRQRHVVADCPGAPECADVAHLEVRADDVHAPGLRDGHLRKPNASRDVYHAAR